MAALDGPFDLVVSNPPYIAHDDIATLAPEVRDFDPPLALDGGADGLDGYRSIAQIARNLLSPDGVLVLELGRSAGGGSNSLPPPALSRSAARDTIFPALRGRSPSSFRHDCMPHFGHGKKALGLCAETD